MSAIWVSGNVNKTKIVNRDPLSPSNRLRTRVRSHARWPNSLRDSGRFQTVRTITLHTVGQNTDARSDVSGGYGECALPVSLGYIFGRFMNELGL